MTHEIRPLIPVPKLSDERMLELYKKLMEEKPKKTTKDFSLEDKTDHLLMNGLSYRNGIYPVDISKTLLPSGTQEEHAQRRKGALTNNSFYTPDYPLFHSIINTLYQNREGFFKNEIEQARIFLSNLIEGEGLMTLTRVRYAPNGQDLVIHNYRQDDQYETPSDFVGPGGNITTTNNAQAPLQALLSTKQSPQEIAQVYNWFRDKPSYLWRLNNRPKRVGERVAGFFAGSGWSSFGCDRDLGDSDSSFGVRRARKN